MNANLYRFSFDRFSDNLDQVFLTEPAHGQVATQSHSYCQVDQRSAVLAGGLVSLGAKIGDRIVVQVDKSVDAIALYFACLRTGLVYVPLNTAYTPNEVRFFLRDAGATVFVYAPDRIDDMAKAMVELPNLITVSLGCCGDGSLPEAARSTEPHNDIVDRADTDLAAMLYTSGTTGRSKGAMLTHRGLRENALALHRVWAFEPGDVLLHTLPIFHVHGLFVALHCAILNRSEVIFCPRFGVDEVLQQLPQASVLMGVPTQYVRLLADSRFNRGLCRHMRLFTSGSAPMTEGVFNSFAHQTGHRICERYGMTECGIITSNPYEGERVAGTVGYALPGYELRVMTETGPAAPGEVGVVEVRGPHLFSGYWQLPDKTAQELTDDGFFRTGDVGQLDHTGRLTLAGRSGDMIISGGLNVYPKEIEAVLDQIEGVAESAVVGLPHPDFGEAVTAFIVLSNNPATGVVDAQKNPNFSAECEGFLARFKQPKQYIVLEKLPRNTMGKVQKAAIRAAYDDLYTSSPDLS